MYIGICGPSGAGKDTAAGLLAKQTGYIHVSGGDILREMLTDLGLEPKKTALGPFGTFIRANYGLEPLFKRVMVKAAGNKGVIVTGIRSPDEANLIKVQGGMIIYIDAAAKVRYDRIVSRKRLHDIANFEDFMLLEQQENNGMGGIQQNLERIRGVADAIVVNDASLDDLTQKLTEIKL